MTKYEYTSTVEEEIVSPIKKGKTKVTKKKTATKPTTSVDVEIIDEIVVDRQGSKIEIIQQKIISLNDDADMITTQALSNAKTSDLTEYQESLVAAIMAIFYWMIW